MHFFAVKKYAVADAVFLLVFNPLEAFFLFLFFFFFFTKVHLFYRYLRVVVYDEKIYSNASPPSLRKQPLFCDATIGFP